MPALLEIAHPLRVFHLRIGVAAEANILESLGIARLSGVPE